MSKVSHLKKKKKKKKKILDIYIYISQDIIMVTQEYNCISLNSGELIGKVNLGTP
jgi:hypothetical protein